MPDVCFFSNKDATVSTLRHNDGYHVTVLNHWEYWITGKATLAFQGSNQLNKKDKLLCLHETIKLNSEGLLPFWTVNSLGKSTPSNPKVVLRSLAEIRSKTIQHRNKEADILSLVAQKIKTSVNPFACTHLTEVDRYGIAIFESAEYVVWIKHLADRQLIEFESEAKLFFDQLDKPMMPERFQNAITTTDSIRLTVRGWEYLDKQAQPTASTKAFIAIAFTDETGKLVSPQLRDRIKTVLSDCGWDPTIVDEEEYNDGVMDKVIALIKESRFVVAELTHQKKGVYYEAGYAKGRGLPVIHVVQNNDLDKCHFDVKHLNLIVWETLDELATKLENRVKATMKKGE